MPSSTPKFRWYLIAPAGPRGSNSSQRVYWRKYQPDYYRTSQRWSLLDNQAGVSQLAAHDPDFTNFVISKSRLLSLVQQEVALVGLRQNPGW